MEFIRNLPLKYPLNLIEGQKERREKFKCVLSGDEPHIVEDPIQIKCGHVVCKHCLEKKFIKQGAFQCSGTSSEPCGEMIDSTQSSFVDQCLKREIKDIVVSCKYGGCQWRGTYVNFREKHVASCESGRSYFLLAAAESMKGEIDGLTEENKKLKIEAAGNQQTITQLRSDLELRDRQIDALTEANNQVKTKAAEKDPRVTKLENDLLDSTRQIQSLEQINKMLLCELQTLQTSHTERQVPEASTRRSKSPQNQPPAKAVEQVREKAFSGVHTKTVIISEEDIFGANAAGTLQEFELGGIKALFSISKGIRYDSISLFCRLVEARSWPCTKSVIFTFKEINGSKEDDLRCEIHFPRGPARCKEKPVNEPCLAVGFRKFCAESALAKKIRSREPNYFNFEGNCRVEITVRDTSAAELIGPGLELAPCSVGLLHWPVQRFASLAASYSTSENRFSSPAFVTAKDGCEIGVKLDTDRYGFQSYVTAQVELRGKNPQFRNWPLEGNVCVTLLDYNPKTLRHLSCFIPIYFDNPEKGIVCGRGKGESEIKEFFRKGVLDYPVAPDQPLYHLGRHDEILVEATFLPA